MGDFPQSWNWAVRTISREGGSLRRGAVHGTRGGVILDDLNRQN